MNCNSRPCSIQSTDFEGQSSSSFFSVNAAFRRDFDAEYKYYCIARNSFGDSIRSVENTLIVRGKWHWPWQCMRQKIPEKSYKMDKNQNCQHFQKLWKVCLDIPSFNHTFKTLGSYAKNYVQWLKKSINLTKIVKKIALISSHFLKKIFFSLSVSYWAYILHNGHILRYYFWKSI